MITRATLSPEVVEPAQPPMMARPASSSGAMPDQFEKPRVPKPVVVMFETTWNVAWRKASLKKA